MHMHETYPILYRQNSRRMRNSLLVWSGLRVLPLFFTFTLVVLEHASKHRYSVTNNYLLGGVEFRAGREGGDFLLHLSLVEIKVFTI